MFTGIIRQVGTVASVRRRAQSCALTVDAGPIAEQTAIGDSVSVNGACLTATEVTGGQITFDVGAETMRRTNLGNLRDGDPVNLEAALRVGDPVGGHFVSGHVDGVGTISRKQNLPGEVRLAIEAAPELTDQMILKGSVALDGISLTIVALRSGALEVSLIPHTLQATTLKHKRAGDRVNIECDMIGRWVRRLLEGAGSGRPGGHDLSVQELEEQGF